MEARMKYLRTIPLMLLVLTAAALFVACGGDDDEGGGEDTEATTRAASSPTDGGDGAAGGPVELELVAENTSYDPTELAAPAGADVTIVFDNDDPDLQHNFALFQSEDALDDPIFEGPIITGVDSTEYKFTAPEEPGTYFYHCDVHPSVMTGDFIVE
jgi:plastocyanin